MPPKKVVDEGCVFSILSAHVCARAFVPSLVMLQCSGLILAEIGVSQSAFYVNLYRAVIGPSGYVTGRWRPDVDLRRMLAGIILFGERLKNAKGKDFAPPFIRCSPIHGSLLRPKGFGTLLLYLFTEVVLFILRKLHMRTNSGSLCYLGC